MIASKILSPFPKVRNRDEYLKTELIGPSSKRPSLPLRPLRRPT